MGNMLYCIDDLNSELFFGYGFYLVNREGNLFYINMNFNINKLLMDLKIKIEFIEIINFRFKLSCVYCLLLIGDLLVVNIGIYLFIIIESNVV